MKQRILVIEDDMDLCRLLKDSLEKEGYEVFVCYNGIHGIKDSEGDRVAGLRLGADDYLIKPFYFSEFLARVSSLLRRYTVFGNGRKEEECIVAEELRINRGKYEVFKGERKIVLTAKEFDLLWFLAENRGQVFTKKQIYQAVWKEEYAFDNNIIMVHIRRLRKKIEEQPENPFYILTVWGIGYKFRDKI